MFYLRIQALGMLCCSTWKALSFWWFRQCRHELDLQPDIKPVQSEIYLIISWIHLNQELNSVLNRAVLYVRYSRVQRHVQLWSCLQYLVESIPCRLVDSCGSSCTVWTRFHSSRRHHDLPIRRGGKQWSAALSYSLRIKYWIIVNIYHPPCHFF